MRYYFDIDENKRLLGISSSDKEGVFSVELNKTDEAFRNPFIFKYENGELIKDEAYQQHLIAQKKAREAQPTLEEQFTSMKKQNADLAFELMMKGVL